MSEEVFNDLPDGGSKPEEVQVEKPPEKQEEKKPDEKPKDSKDIALDRKSQAITEERGKRRAAEARAKELEDEVKRLKGEEVEEEIVEEAPVEAKIDESKLVETVTQNVLKTQEAKQAEEEAIKAIRDLPGMTKARANELLSEWRALPNKSRYASVDIKFLDQRITELRQMDVGYVPQTPTGNGEVGHQPATINGVSPLQYEIGKKAGLEDEDFKKYNGKQATF